LRFAHILLALAWLAVSSVSARAVDLTKIDRTIAKEPAYQTKTPRYCLVVFGAEAKARMWLVLDGKVLYVDRKGDGDLTGADKVVEINPERKRFDITALSPTGSPFEYSELVVHVKDEGRCEINLKRKADLSHRKMGNDLLTIMAGFKDVSSRDWMSREHVAEYDFRFGDSPREAPIVHVDGPLTLRPILTNQVFVRGDTPTQFPVMVGTRGLGKGTFTQLMFRPGDPDGMAEIVFPPRDPKGKPFAVKVALKSPD
jgi:hypothetical protein